MMLVEKGLSASHRCVSLIVAHVLISGTLLSLLSLHSLISLISLTVTFLHPRAPDLSHAEPLEPFFIPLIGQYDPFKTKIDKGNKQPSGPSTKNARDVFMYFNIYSINKVSQVDQCFDAHFYLRATWVVDQYLRDFNTNEFELDENGDNKLNPKESCVDPDMLANFDFDTWETQPMTKDVGNGPEPAPVFCPKIRWRGDQPQLVQQELKPSLWRKGPNDETVMEYSVYVHGTFLDALELDNFPMDVMDLKLRLVSGMPTHIVKFKPDDLGHVGSEKISLERRLDWKPNQDNLMEASETEGHVEVSRRA